MIWPLTPGCSLLPWRLDETSLMTFPGILRRSCCSDLRSALMTTAALVNTGNGHKSWTQGSYSEVRATRVGSQGESKVRAIKGSQGSQILTLSQQQMKNAGKWHWLIFPIAFMTHLYSQWSCIEMHWRSESKLTQLRIPNVSIRQVGNESHKSTLLQTGPFNQLLLYQKLSFCNTILLYLKVSLWIVAATSHYFHYWSIYCL